MCDYSLCGIPNRLAVEGEELVVHRDAIRFQNRFEVHLQDLREGMHVRVLSLAGAPEYAPLEAAMTNR